MFHIDALKGREITRLGKRHKAEPIVKSPESSWRNDILGRRRRVGPGCGRGHGFLCRQRAPGSDYPLQIDLTHYAQLDPLKSWLQV